MLRSIALSLYILNVGSLVCQAQDLETYSYDIGSPSLTEYYIDIANGSDSNNGRSINAAWKTVTHAWNQIPTSAALNTGYRFNLMNGEYGSDELPNYWELKQGTANFPIILRAATGQSSVKFTRDINMANISYFYLIGIEISPAGGGDAFHCESCNHLLIRGCVLDGGSKTTGAHETLKVNQSQYVYIENNNILYADDNNIDFVGVQYGHIIGNKVHDAGDWCAYVKGGSAYIRIEANEFYNCATGGVTAGQGSGFQFMTSPWIHYEAYDIKIINNLVRDTEGAAFGVNGGYNVIIAHNTAYKIGTRSHMLEVVFGERTCDGETDGESNTTCATFNAAGGWGPSTVRTTPAYIGNRNVYILNNLLYNPSGTNSPQHFAIYGPRTPLGDVNLSAPQVADTNLIIAGNVIWNAPETSSIGIEESDQGCQAGNATCTLSQIQADNQINSSEPALIDPAGSDLRPQPASSLLSAPTASLANFPGGDRQSTPIAPEGNLSNTFSRDFSGATTAGIRTVGAFTNSESALAPPAIDGSDTPSDPLPSPTLSALTVKLKKVGAKLKVTASVTVTSSEPITSVIGQIRQGTKNKGSFTLVLTSGSKYTGSRKIKALKGKAIRVTVTAANSGGSAAKTKKTNY